MLRALIAVFALVVASHAHAHDGMHDDFLKSLTDQSGNSCCDGSDAFAVLDPDWWIAGDHYVVRLNGQEIKVPEKSIVKQNNEIGVAKVWPVFTFGKIEIRCFLPGSGS